MNLRQLEAFLAVMTSGSVTQAANAMHLSQPAVSKLIADLEHAVGFRLFIRNRGAALIATPEAQLFYFEVERSFIGIEALRRIAGDIRNLSVGNVRIAALPALAVSFLPAVLKRFQDQHPQVTIQLQTRSSSTVRQWIANQQFDLGLATTAREADGVTARRFLRCAGACVLPPGHPLTSKAEIRPEDLRDQPFISLAGEDPSRRRIDRVFEEAGVTRRLTVETQYAMTICGLVLQGVGCSILNPVTASDFAAKGLVVRPFTPRIDFEYMLYVPTVRPQSQSAARFIEVMVQVRDELIAEGAFGPSAL